MSSIGFRERRRIINSIKSFFIAPPQKKIEHTLFLIADFNGIDLDPLLAERAAESLMGINMSESDAVDEILDEMLINELTTKRGSTK